MASPTKKTRSSCLLYLLIVLIVLIVLCSAGLAFFFLRSSSPSPAVNATSLPLVRSHPVLPTRTPSTEATTVPTTAESTTVKVTTTVGTTSAMKAMETTKAPSTTTKASATSAPSTTTESTSTSTTEVPTTQATTTTTMEPITTTELPNELLSSCSAVVATSVSCARTTADVSAAGEDWFEPLLYKLNLSLAQPQINQRRTQLNGAAQIFFRVNRDGNQISFNAAQALRGIENLAIVDCTSGKTLCVSKAVSEGEVTSLLISDAIASGSVLRIDFPQFTSESTPGPDDFVYSKTPTRSRRVTPIMVGSKLRPGSARKMFPSFDSPQKKARISLCVAHWSEAEVRANSPVLSSSEKETCFQPSLPMSPDQISFSVFQRAEKLSINATNVDDQPVPSVELVFSTGAYKKEKHEWIYPEATKAISTLTKWFSFPLPLEKLHIVSAPIQNSISSLGFISFREFFFEYPTYFDSHTSLTRSVLSQWIGGVVAVERCFQEALTTYLEWKLNEELGFVNRSRAHETAIRRPFDLSKDDVRGSRSIRSLPQESCAERDVAIFFSLDETYGKDTVTKMVKEVLRRFAFSSASLDDWKSAAEVATGRPQAGAALFEWFSRRSHPVVQLVVRSQEVSVKQMSSNPWTLSLELAGSSGKQLVDINEAEQVIPFSSDDYVVMDPERKSTAFVVYDADGYSRLKRCWDSRACPATQSSLKSIFRDFGAVLLGNLLPPMEQRDKAKWNDFLQFALQHIEGDAACCVAFALRKPSSAHCTWVVKDVCPRLRFGSL